jgi:aminoglycoside phosphotransferase (APT) family kinase protein
VPAVATALPADCAGWQNAAVPEPTDPGRPAQPSRSSAGTTSQLIDAGSIARWLGRPVTVEGRASTGSSNVTWLVRVDGEPAVLRHPPPGAILPTAHDLARERRYIAALAGTGVPVPTVVAFCEQVDVIGAPFLITSRMAGVCLLQGPVAIEDPQHLAGDAVSVLAGIHAVDWERAGLTPAPGRYLERQVRRWREQLRLTPSSGRLGDLDVISDWLLAHLPPTEERTVVHGDYGFHNLLIDPERSAVTAVLDWELATIGDPLSDLVSFAKGWGPASAPPNPANVSLRAPGWRPTQDELVAWYEASTGRSLAPARRFYEVFGRWRSIGIMERIFARTGGSRFGDEVPLLVRDTTAMLGDP